MSPEISALDKHACPACGAQAEWNPAKQKLVCPFCGTESPYVIDREVGKAKELDLIEALRNLPDEKRGWQTERRSVRCKSCNAVMSFAPDRVGQNCEFCGSPALVPYDEIEAPIRPETLLPFKIDKGHCEKVPLDGLVRADHRNVVFFEAGREQIVHGAVRLGHGSKHADSQRPFDRDWLRHVVAYPFYALSRLLFAGPFRTSPSGPKREP